MCSAAFLLTFLLIAYTSLPPSPSLPPPPSLPLLLYPPLLSISLAITKQNLGELRHEVEGRSAENHRLHLQLDERSLQRHQDQAKLDEVSSLSPLVYFMLIVCDQLLSENEDLKEKLTVLEATHSSATCDMDDLQQRYEQCVALLQEKHSEIQSLKEMSGYRRYARHLV